MNPNWEPTDGVLIHDHHHFLGCVDRFVVFRNFRHVPRPCFADKPSHYADDRAVVYTLRNHVEGIVYIGVTKDPFSRAHAHWKSGKMGYFGHMDIETPFLPYHFALALEAVMINDHKTRYGRTPPENGPRPPTTSLTVLPYALGTAQKERFYNSPAQERLLDLEIERNG